MGKENNNTAILELFEEIKLLVSKQQNSNQTTTASPPVDLSGMEKRINEFMDNASKQQFDRFKQLLNDKLDKIEMPSVPDNTKLITSKFDEIICSIQQKENKPQRIYHTIDLKSSKVVTALVSLSLIVLFSLAGNIYQFQANRKLSDNDLKYRYMKSVCKGEFKLLLELDNTFDYNRNEDDIKFIRHQVKEYENAVKKQAETLENSQSKKKK